MTDARCPCCGQLFEDDGRLQGVDKCNDHINVEHQDAIPSPLEVREGAT